MAWYRFGGQCCYRNMLCQERSGCVGCGIYYEHQERLNEIQAKANEVPEVHRDTVFNLSGLQVARKEVV